MMPALTLAKGLRAQYSAMTGRTRIDLDPLAKRQLRNAYAAGSAGECAFFACPGPDATRFIPMATCSRCYSRIYLRRALLRLGIETED